jgi:hypothetical protein
MFGIPRARKKGPYGKSETDFIERMMAHFKRASRMRSEFFATQQCEQRTLDVLESNAIGVAVLAADGRVVRANPRLDALLSSAVGISMRNGRLCLCESSSQRALDGLMDWLRRARTGLTLDSPQSVG